jgi:hypothetical protein
MLVQSRDTRAERSMSVKQITTLSAYNGLDFY